MWNYNPKNLKEFKKWSNYKKGGGGNPSLELFNHNA